MNRLSDKELLELKEILSRFSSEFNYYDQEESDSKPTKPIKKTTSPSVGQAVDDFLAGLRSKYAEFQRPSDADLRRMYDVVQADASLTKRIAGLGFGNSGDAYRKAALKLQILAIMNVLRDGKNIRNDIVHRPGYIPSEQSTNRALMEYAKADSDITDYLNNKSTRGLR